MDSGYMEVIPPDQPDPVLLVAKTLTGQTRSDIGAITLAEQVFMELGKAGYRLTYDPPALIDGKDA